MINYKLSKSKNSAQALLAAGISAAGDTVQLKSGEASLFPSGNKGSATSLGSSTVLNSTGIGAKVSVGDFIRNLTDGSKAFVLSTSTDSITTTPLDSGSDNTWQSSDEWVVGSFYAWLSKKDGSGEDTTRELVFVEYVNSSSDQMHIETRAVEGLATAFDADDYVSVYVSAQYLENLNLSIADLQARKAEDDEVVHNTGNETIAGVKTFSSLPLLPAGTPTGQEAVSKAFLETFTSSLGQAKLAQFTAGEAISEDDVFRAGDPSAVATSITSYTTTGTGYSQSTANMSSIGHYFLFDTTAEAINIEKFSFRGQVNTTGTYTVRFTIWDSSGSSQIGSFSDDHDLYYTGSVMTTKSNLLMPNLAAQDLDPSTTYRLVMKYVSAPSSGFTVDGGSPNPPNTYRQIYLSTNLGESADKVYICGATDEALGIATAAAALDEEFTGLYDGATTQFTGLTPGATYYAAASGGIDTSGTVKIGKAIKSNLLLFSANTQI